MVKLSNILDAASRIDPVFLSTPMISSPDLNAILGCRLFAKVETMNPIGSFKGRGTEFFVNTVLQQGESIVSASAGMLREVPSIVVGADCTTYL
jgi:threonine dehydratase